MERGREAREAVGSFALFLYGDTKAFETLSTAIYMIKMYQKKFMYKQGRLLLN